MLEHRSRAGAALALAAALACAAPGAASRPARSPGATRETVLRDAYLRFPDEQFIVGYGVGGEPAEAERAAQADAAAQIRSAATSNAQSGVVSAATVAGEQVTRELVERTVVQVATDAGACIRPWRELARQSDDGRHHAIAVADRRELDARYVEEARPLEARFRELAGRVKAARGWLDAAGTYCELEAVARAIDAKNVERYLVSRRWLWSPELEGLRSDAEKRYQGAKARLRIIVARAGEPLRSDPADAILRSLDGWAARAGSAAACSGEGVLVAPSVDARCRTGEAGAVLCRASLRVEARACGSVDALFTVTSAPVEASDPREQERARASALRRLGAEEIVAPAAKEAAGKLRAILGERCDGGA